MSIECLVIKILVSVRVSHIFKCLHLSYHVSYVAIGLLTVMCALIRLTVLLVCLATMLKLSLPPLLPVKYVHCHVCNALALLLTAPTATAGEC